MLLYVFVVEKEIIVNSFFVCDWKILDLIARDLYVYVGDNSIDIKGILY